MDPRYQDGASGVGGRDRMLSPANAAMAQQRQQEELQKIIQETTAHFIDITASKGGDKFIQPHDAAQRSRDFQQRMQNIKWDKARSSRSIPRPSTAVASADDGDSLFDEKSILATARKHLQDRVIIAAEHAATASLHK